MARTRGKSSGTGLFFIALLVVGLLLFLSAGRFPGLTTTGFQATAFDTKTSGAFTTGYNCQSSYFGSNSGSGAYVNYPCNTTGINVQSQTIGSTSSFFNLPIAYLGSDSNDGTSNGPALGQNNCRLTNLVASISGACGHASLLLGAGPQTIIGGGGKGPTPAAIVSPAAGSKYALTGSVLYPYNKVGSDPNFQTKFKESVPSCNPCTIANNTYILEYGFAVRLQIIGDQISVSASCAVAFSQIAYTDSFCPGSEVDAINQALSFINTNDGAAGTVLVDLTIPPTLGATSQDKLGIIGAWIGTNQCAVTPTLTTSTASVNPCSNHALVPITNIPYSSFNYQDIKSFTSSQFPQSIISNLQTSVSMSFSYSIAPNYKAVCTNTAGGQSNPVPCSTQSQGTYQVVWDQGITIDVPIIFDVFDQTPNPSGPSGGGTGGGVGGCGSNCPQYGSTGGSIAVHVTGPFGLPLQGVAVAALPASSGAIASSCSTSAGYTGTTDVNGNYNFTNLSTGGGSINSAFICATGSTGTMTLIFISLGVTYVPAGTTCTLSVSPNNNCNLSLQANLNVNLATASYLAIGVGILVLVIFLVVPSQRTFGVRRRGTSVSF